MKAKRLFYIIIAVIVALTATYNTEAYAAKRGSKTKTTQSNSASKQTSSRSTKANSRNYSKGADASASSSKKRSSTSSRSSKHSRRNTYKPTDNNTPAPVSEVAQNDSLTLAVNDAVLKWIPNDKNPGGLRVNSVKPDHDKRYTRVGLNENFTYLPVTQEFINGLTKTVKKNLPDSIRDYRLALQVGNNDLSYYINRIDKLPEQYRKNTPFVYSTDPYGDFSSKGMAGDIIALWHSHGRYFKNGAWVWQRPQLFQTMEDVFTMEYILPYVVPMLENSGAYVMLPRERDVNTNEVIVDSDINPDGQLYSQTTYKEIRGDKPWVTGEEDGFIYDLPDFRDTENPFEGGEYRQTTTIKGGKESKAAWYADIPEAGEYAVYVSYKTLPESTSDALYTVNYSGGSKQFRVNQQMGGGTWIYLGTFPLEAGYSDNVPIVTLTNKSNKEAGKIVTADAVKIGGGMGNIARSSSRRDIYYDPSTPDNSTSYNSTNDQNDDEEEDEGDEGDEEDDEDDEDIDAQPEQQPQPQQQTKTYKKGYAPTFRTSGMPRFVEGARYWLHWAGVPESVYSPYHGNDDYKDDYTDRGHWVNWLAGGSRVLPNREGLGIPVDLSMALHSDAGKRADDSIVGTLGIYYTQGGRSYQDGTPRINSRMLTDMLMRQITGDIRQTWEPNWTRRSMWDKSYLEARVAEVPTALIELLSHQNFGDMQYGLDPNFQFTVGRAIYKGMARFLAERKGREVVIQPLPVHDFSIDRMAAGKYKLSWKPTPDKLEPTAMPNKYIILERSQGNLGFTKIGETKATHFDLTVKGHDIHSLKVIAVNDGGASFPSETLSLREPMSGKPVVLIINGFDRVSAPGHFSEDKRAGFNAKEDFGVPYIRSISFSGYQNEFNRGSGDRFGWSDTNYLGKVIAGNTFDYPALHGAAIADAGYGFVSTSAGAVENDGYDINKYKIIDLILGKQKQTTVGKGSSGIMYKAFPEALQKKLTAFAKKGGNIFVSGQYVASDLTTDADKKFGREILGIVEGDKESLRNDRIEVIPTQMSTGIKEQKYAYNNQLNDKIYIVENPDAIDPDFDQDGAELFMLFDGTDAGAGVVLKSGKRRAVTMSVPFESIPDAAARRNLMRQILDFLK